MCPYRPDRDSRGRVKTKQVSVEPPQEASHEEVEDLKMLDEVLAKARHVKVWWCVYQSSSTADFPGEIVNYALPMYN